MATIFINEFHYTGTDNQFVEIAGPAGSDLSNYSVVVYNNDGTILKTEPLSDTIQNQGDGFGTVAVEFDDIPEDGAIALLDSGALVGTAANNDLQFLSYGGTVTASINSNSVTSSDIGVVETATTASLQLQGTDGDASSDFKWKRVNAGASKGAINSDQTFDNTQVLGDDEAPNSPTIPLSEDEDTNTSGLQIERTGDLEIDLTENNAASGTSELKAGTGNIVIKKTSDNSTVATFDVTNDDEVEISGTKVTLKDYDLVDNTGYYIAIDAGAITDLAGNAYTPASGDQTALTFTAEDNIDPQVTDAGPNAVIDSSTKDINATQVDVDSNLTLTFDEEVQQGSGTIRLYKNDPNSSDANATTGFDGSTIDPQVQANVTFDGNTVTIDPVNPLDGNAKYFVEIGIGAVEDKSGRDFPGISNLSSNTKPDWVINTAVSDAPEVISKSPESTTPDDPNTPVDESKNVLVDKDLEITFNENVRAGSGNIVIKDASDDSVFEEIDVTSSQVTFEDNKVTINPSKNFDANSTYYVEIAASVIEDTDGNDYDGSITGTSAFTFNTVEDIDAPELADDDFFAPEDNEENVATDRDIVIKFNEDVKAGEGKVSIKKVSDDSVVGEIEFDGTSNPTITNAGVIDITNFGNSTDAFSSDTLTIEINQTNNISDLDPSTEYYVEIEKGAITDLVGNEYEGFTDSDIFNFTTASSEGPVIINQTPNDNATNVAIDAPLVIEFNEDVQVGANPSGGIALKSADGTDVREFFVSNFNADTSTTDPNDGTITTNGNTATISGKELTITPDPTNPLQAGTEYFVEISPNALDSTDGDDFAGFLGNTRFNFTTAASDAPVAIGFSTDDDDTTAENENESVALNSNLSISFNEDVQEGDGFITIFNADGTEVEKLDVDEPEVQSDGNTITINPSADLESNTTYYVQVDAGAIEDLGGEAFGGINDTTIFRFTTNDDMAPEVVAGSESPADNDTDVAVDANISFNLGEDVTAVAGKNITITPVGGTPITIAADDTTQVSIVNGVVTINPTADLMNGQEYTVEVESGAFIDGANNEFDGTLATDGTFNFFTTLPDTTDPVLTGATSPADNGTDIAVDANISFNLGEDVTAVAGKNITITPTGGTAITIAADDATQVSIVNGVVTINPTADLMNGQEYTVEVESGAFIDGANNEFDGTLATDGTFNFTTVADPTTPPVNPITPVEAGSPIGTVTEDGNVMEVIDLTGAQFAGQTVTASFEVSREADYDNNIYFYTVDAADGNIGGLAPDASGYLQAALNNVVGSAINAEDGANDDMGSFTLQGGDILGIAIVADGTLAEATSDISSVEGVYLSYMGANTDSGSFDHVRYNNGMFEFEDLANGGDADFNDIQVSIDFTV